MKFGVCCGVENLPVLRQYGYDYIELNFSNLSLAEEQAFEQTRAQLRQYGIAAESFNCFFPGGVNLNADVDYEWIAEYAERGFSRAEQLGGKIAVLGSGGARRIPDGYDRDLAVQQFVKVLRICGDIAQRHGMQIAVEPLRESECNFINTVAEGLELCKLADHESVKCLVDFFHLSMNGETLDAVRHSGDWIVHAHMARPNADRHIPAACDADSCAPWANVLKEIGYNGRLSLEGEFYPDFETAVREVRPVLELFR